MADDAFIEKLLSRNSEYAAALAECLVIEDVLTGNVTKRKKPSDLATLRATNANPMVDNGSLDGKTPPNYPSMANAGEFHYLPKGKLEAAEEYTKRVQMTPWFPKTPNIRNDRQGALFSDPPEIEYKKDGEKEEISEADKELLESFLESATAAGDAFMSAIVRTAAAIQQYPMAAIFIDRAILPDDVKARVDAKEPISKAEVAERKLGKPQLVLYCGEQILDLEKDSRGLAWIKVVETKIEKPTWDAKPKIVYTVRSIDRVNIQSYRIEEIDNKRTVETLPVVAHGFKVVPVILATAFPDGSEEYGRPSLLGPALADVAATRILSDLVWTLFVVGNPILTFKTNRGENELIKVNTNATRYFPLQNSKGTQDAESLEFVSLDPTGLTMLIEMWQFFRQEADNQGGKDAPAAITGQGVQQASGVSKAWTFKTGQERLLFLLTRELEHAFDRVLDLVCEAIGIDPDLVTIRFNTKFDMRDPAELADSAEKILGIIAKDSPTLTAQIKYRVATETFDDLEDLDEIKKELENPPEPEPPIIAASPMAKPPLPTPDQNAA